MNRNNTYSPNRSGGSGSRQSQEPQELIDYVKFLKSKPFTDDDVMKLSEQLSKQLSKKYEGKENTRTQVRKFYNLFRITKTRTQYSESAQEIKVKIRILQAQIAYAVGRKTLDDNFKKFFDKSIDKILENNENKELKKSLDEFVIFFETFYAYFYCHTKGKTNNE